MLNLLLVDTELEIVPKIMADDYAIRINAKKRKKPASKLLLDSNFMHAAIERYFPSESNRRGRPDIVYHFLEVAMESILNKKGEMRVWIHTRNNLIVELNPEVRLPKSYNRFVGLMEDLFDKGQIMGPDGFLLRLHDGDFKTLLELSGHSKPVILSPKGTKTNIRKVFDVSGKDTSVIIGGFSEGDFRSPVYDLGHGYSIFDEELTIWSVGMELICQYERDFNVV